MLTPKTFMLTLRAFTLTLWQRQRMGRACPPFLANLARA